MALPATDTFTNTGGSDIALTTYSATNWGLNQGNFGVSYQFDGCYPNAGTGEGGAVWIADSFDADHYAQCVFSRSEATGPTIGVGVRHAAASTATYYGYYGNTDDSYLIRVKNGSYTDLTGGTGSTGAWTVGKTYRLEVSGTNPVVLTCKEDGVTVYTYSDSSADRLTSGSAGITGYYNSANVQIDNWEGGNLSTVTNIDRAPGVGSVQATGAAGTLAFTMPPGVGALQFVGAAPTVLNEVPKQYAYPTSDVSNESWTASVGSDLYACVDDDGAANDSDYIQSPAAPTGHTVVLQLGSLNTPDAGTVTLRVRAKWVA